MRQKSSRVIGLPVRVAARGTVPGGNDDAGGNDGAGRGAGRAGAPGRSRPREKY